MATTGQNAEIYQGDYHELIITVVDEDGVVADLSGYSAVWCLYGQTEGNIVLTKTTSDGITITGGQITIELENVDTENLTPRIYGHQCEVEDIMGRHSTVTTGYVKILKSITHSSL